MQANNDDIPSTGEVVQSDTTVVVSINLLRQANIKMIERLYLIDINVKQKLIINNQKEYINYQSAIIDNYKERIIYTNKINKELSDSINKRKKQNIIFYTIGGSVILGVVVGLIIK